MIVEGVEVWPPDDRTGTGQEERPAPEAPFPRVPSGRFLKPLRG
jgi:hypothetical protein